MHRGTSTEHLVLMVDVSAQHRLTAMPNKAVSCIDYVGRCLMLLKLLSLPSYLHNNVKSEVSTQQLPLLSLIIFIATVPALHAARLQAGAGSCHVPHTRQAAAPGKGHAGAGQPTRRSV